MILSYTATLARWLFKPALCSPEIQWLVCAVKIFPVPTNICSSVFSSYLNNELMWLWGLWLLSQLWITLHIWFPVSTRLAATEQLFGSPMYSGLFIDQSVTMNRRRDGENDFNWDQMRDEMQV